MHAIASLFDRKNDRFVRSLWKKLRDEFHVQGVYKTPFPHFSYQIASDYKFEYLEKPMEIIARQSKPFSVRAGGLGVFTGLAPVLYIPIVRTKQLSSFHELLIKRISSACSGSPVYYNAEFWVPHITIAQWDINEKNLPQIIGSLSKRELSFEIKVNNIAAIYDDGMTQSIRSKFSFE